MQRIEYKKLVKFNIVMTIMSLISLIGFWYVVLNYGLGKLIDEKHSIFISSVKKINDIEKLREITIGIAESIKSSNESYLAGAKFLSIATIIVILVLLFNTYKLWKINKENLKQ